LKDCRRITQPFFLHSGNKISHGRAWLLIWIFVLLVAGCGSSTGRIIIVTNEQPGQTLVASVGDTIEVTLQTIGPGQYGDPLVSSGSLRFLGQSPAGAPNPGGPRQLYRFEAVTSGQAEITIRHTGGLPQGPTPPAFTLFIKVQ
jgi:hypothetical protein